MIYRNIFFSSAVFHLLCATVSAHVIDAPPTDAKSQVVNFNPDKPPLGLPPIPWPKNNPYSKEKADLGRLLYFDKRLSGDQTVSCATCHNKPCGYSDCHVIAIGIDNHKGTRHSPTVINSAYFRALFWDGRANSLEEQSKGPLANPHEMSSVKDPHEAHKLCVERIKDVAGYKPLFKKAFGSEDITLDTITQAIATFERTVLSGNAPYDRYIKGDHTAMTEEQIRGLTIFKKVGCANCHIEPIFTDSRFHNIGVGMKDAKPDLGRYEITHDENDWGAFKTPPLRETSHGGPYMHDGSIETLEGVIDYYNEGGNKNKNLHPLMKPLNLTKEDKKALMSFMEALNGEGWENITEPSELPQ